jgi:hypothetical protein
MNAACFFRSASDRLRTTRLPQHPELASHVPPISIKNHDVTVELEKVACWPFACWVL